MSRVLLLLALAAVGGCASPTYSIQEANAGTANERATRYCDEQDATARLVTSRPAGGGGDVQVYRCVPR